MSGVHRGENVPRSGKAERPPGRKSHTVCGLKSEKADKQNAKNKGWDEINSAKREKTISGQRNSIKIAQWQ